MLLASLREALTPLPRSLMLALDLLEKGWIWAEGQAGEAVSAPAPFFFFLENKIWVSHSINTFSTLHSCSASHRVLQVSPSAVHIYDRYKVTG